MNTDLKHTLFSFKKTFDESLDAYLHEKSQEFEVVDPTMSDMLHQIRLQIMRSGKRIRPFLLRQSYLLSGGTDENLLMQLCIAVELLHQHFLIHDDVIDRDETRYGGSSLHETYAKDHDDAHFGNSMAILSGDLLISMVHELFLTLSTTDDLRLQLHSMLNKTVTQTIAGMQIHFLQNRQLIDEELESKYMKGMEMVSGYYTFISPLTMGSVASGNPQYVHELRAYGAHAGLAFQIGDDLLGMFGNSEKTGKPAGNDFREGKKTLLILRSYKNGTQEQRAYIEKHLGTQITQKQLAEIKDIMTHTGALEYSQNLLSTHTKAAKKSIMHLPTHTTVPDILSSLADFLKDRDK